MKKNSLVLSFLFIASFSFSQVAGYMGKRFVIAYENYFFPAFMGPGTSNANKNSMWSPGFNSVHCLNLDFTAKNRINFCVTLQYMKTGIAYRTGSSRLLNTNSSYGTIYPYPHEDTSTGYTSSNGSRYGGDFSTPAVLSSFNIGGGVKIFSPGSIAPVGRYIKFEVLVFHETVTYDNQNFYIQDYNSSFGNINNETKVTEGTGIYHYQNFTISFTSGRQRVLGNRIVLDYGFRIGLTPSVIPVFLEVSEKKGMSDSYRTYSTYRLFRQQLFNLHIGIGFLAF